MKRVTMHTVVVRYYCWKLFSLVHNNIVKTSTSFWHYFRSGYCYVSTIDTHVIYRAYGCTLLTYFRAYWLMRGICLFKREPFSVFKFTLPRYIKKISPERPVISPQQKQKNETCKMQPQQHYIILTREDRNSWWRFIKKKSSSSASSFFNT